MNGYKGKLNDGREIYIPTWAVDVALENVTLAGKYLGIENVINIAELNTAAVIVAIMSAKEPKLTVGLIKHFVCTVRIEGSKILPETLNEMFEGDLKSIAEIFSHVVHSQYSDFFELGLAKENSQDS